MEKSFSPHRQKVFLVRHYVLGLLGTVSVSPLGGLMRGCSSQPRGPQRALRALTVALRAGSPRGHSCPSGTYLLVSFPSLCDRNSWSNTMKFPLDRLPCCGEEGGQRDCRRLRGIRPPSVAERRRSSATGGGPHALRCCRTPEPHVHRKTDFT